MVIFFFFFSWCKCGVFQCYMKGCRGRLTCLPLIYCLLSWNGRIAGVRTKTTQQGVKPKSTAGFSCINCCSTQLDLICDALPVSSEEGWINVVFFENLLETREQIPAPLWCSRPPRSYWAPPGFYRQWTWNQRRKALRGIFFFQLNSDVHTGSPGLRRMASFSQLSAGQRY